MKINNLDLIKNFKTSSDYFYGDNINTIHKSKHWKVYDFRDFNLENLVNFRSENKLSDGLDDQTNEFNFSIFARIVKEISEDYILKNSPKLNIGNSQSLIKYKNVLIDFNKLIHIHWFFTIDQEILKKKIYQTYVKLAEALEAFPNYS